MLIIEIIIVFLQKEILLDTNTFSYLHPLKAHPKV